MLNYSHQLRLALGPAGGPVTGRFNLPAARLGLACQPCPSAATGLDCHCVMKDTELEKLWN